MHRQVEELSCIDQINEILVDLQSQADNIQSTTSRCGMTINFSTTTVMLCSRTPERQESLNLQFGGDKIE